MIKVWDLTNPSWSKTSKIQGLENEKQEERKKWGIQAQRHGCCVQWHAGPPGLETMREGVWLSCHLGNCPCCMPSSIQYQGEWHSAPRHCTTDTVSAHSALCQTLWWRQGTQAWGISLLSFRKLSKVKALEIWIQTSAWLVLHSAFSSFSRWEVIRQAVDRKLWILGCLKELDGV